MPRTQPAAEAAELMLASAGASLRRDAVDERAIADVRSRSGALIDSQPEVGGFPVRRSGLAAIDSDRAQSLPLKLST